MRQWLMFWHWVLTGCCWLFLRWAPCSSVGCSWYWWYWSLALGNVPRLGSCSVALESPCYLIQSTQTWPVFSSSTSRTQKKINYTYCNLYDICVQQCWHFILSIHVTVLRPSKDSFVVSLCCSEPWASRRSSCRLYPFFFQRHCWDACLTVMQSITDHHCQIGQSQSFESELYKEASIKLCH